MDFTINILQLNDDGNSFYPNWLRWSWFWFLRVEWLIDVAFGLHLSPLHEYCYWNRHWSRSRSHSHSHSHSRSVGGRFSFFFFFFLQIDQNIEASIIDCLETPNTSRLCCNWNCGRNEIISWFITQNKNYKLDIISWSNKRIITWTMIDFRPVPSISNC